MIKHVNAVYCVPNWPILYYIVENVLSLALDIPFINSGVWPVRVSTGQKRHLQTDEPKCTHEEEEEHRIALTHLTGHTNVHGHIKTGLKKTH